jgi:hypothetical protein
VDQQVEPAVEGRADLAEDARDVFIRADVARRDERALDLRCELANVAFDPLALVREGESGPGVGEPLRNRPGDRALVRDAENQSVLPLEIDVRTLWIFGYIGLPCAAFSSSHRSRR